MKINLLKLFRNKNEFQDKFPLEQFNALPGEKFAYPLFYPWKRRVYMLTQYDLW